MLEIDPIAKITRTGKIQGISYRSGNAVVRGSDLQRASFPALQQRGIEFDPARDVPNLKSAIRGERLDVDREWVDDLSTLPQEQDQSPLVSFSDQLDFSDPSPILDFSELVVEQDLDYGWSR